MDTLFNPELALVGVTAEYIERIYIACESRAEPVSVDEKR